MGLASLNMFVGGAFSTAPHEPFPTAPHELRADADKLANLNIVDLARGMEVRDDNPLVGLDGRADLLRRLGRLVASKPDIFASNGTPRPGGLYDRLAMLADGGKLPAPTILAELLQQLGPIWPSRLTLGGIALGDCWRHPALTTADATSGLVPAVVSYVPSTRTMNLQPTAALSMFTTYTARLRGGSGLAWSANDEYTSIKSCTPETFAERTM